MSDEEFWEEYDIIHNNKHKSVCEIDKMLCECKNFAKRVQKSKSVDTLIVCKSINRMNFRLHISAILAIQHHPSLVS